MHCICDVEIQQLEQKKNWPQICLFFFFGFRKHFNGNNCFLNNSATINSLQSLVIGDWVTGESISKFKLKFICIFVQFPIWFFQFIAANSCGVCCDFHLKSVEEWYLIFGLCFSAYRMLSAKRRVICRYNMRGMHMFKIGNACKS